MYSYILLRLETSEVSSNNCCSLCHAYTYKIFTHIYQYCIDSSLRCNSVISATYWYLPFQMDTSHQKKRWTFWHLRNNDNVLMLIVPTQWKSIRSQWGHDFRHDYVKLGILKYHFPSIPFLAITATASPNVMNDIKQILRGSNVSERLSRRI